MDYKFLLVPFAALILAQIIKMMIDGSQGRFSWKDIDSYGGMPSSHAAFLAAALVEAAKLYNINSAIFAVVAFLSFVVLRDAVGLRQEVGNQAQIINQIITDLPDKAEDKYPKLETRIGHTYPQLIAGLIIGAALALII